MDATAKESKDPSWLLDENIGQTKKGNVDAKKRLSLASNSEYPDVESRASLSGPSRRSSYGKEDIDVYSSDDIVSNYSKNEIGGSRRRSSLTYDDDFDDADIIDCFCCSYDPFIFLLQLYHLTSFGFCVCSILANIYVVSKGLSDDPKDFSIRIFSILFSLMLIFCEFDVRLFTKYFRLFDLWLFRGMLYSFIGLVTIQYEEAISLFQNVVGLGMICIGIFYVLMTMMCVKTIQQRRDIHRGYKSIDEVSLRNLEEAERPRVSK